MHRLFYINELVDHIVGCATQTQGKLERLDDFRSSSLHGLNGLSYDAHRDLKALSLTNKIFREPCLKASWRRQSSLIPLFRALGIVSYEPEKSFGPINVYVCHILFSCSCRGVFTVILIMVLIAIGQTPPSR